jgi:AraC-like DNA-binding protein
MGLIQQQPFHSTPITKQGDVMLTVVIGGSGRVTSGDETKEIGPGTVGLVTGGATGVLMSDPENPYIHYYTRFRGEYAQALAAEITAMRGCYFGLMALGPEFAQELHAHGKIARHGLPNSCGPEGLSVLGILERMRDVYRPGGKGAALPFESRVRDYLFDNVASPTSLDRIAADLGVSRATLTRKTRDRTGMSVQQLHEQIKVEWAKTLLTSTSATVGEVARRVGYDDPFYFSRVFRRHTATAPRTYRA